HRRVRRERAAAGGAPGKRLGPGHRPAAGGRARGALRREDRRRRRGDRGGPARARAGPRSHRRVERDDQRASAHRGKPVRPAQQDRQSAGGAGTRRLASVSPEDQKIITLARSTRARVAASEGAAVRDETGRTYTAAAVALPSLRLSALRLAVAMAVSSGAASLEAAALVSDSDPDPGDLAAVRDLGPSAPVFHAAPDGTLRATLVP